MLNIDKLRYDYERPFLDFINQLDCHENILWVHNNTHWVFFRTGTHFFINRSIYIRFLQYDRPFFVKIIKKELNTKNLIIKYPSSFEKEMIEYHLNINMINQIKDVL